MGSKYSLYANKGEEEITKVVNQLTYEQSKFNQILKKRDYTINIIGYGNIGKPLLKELCEVVKEPNSQIKKINVWFRDKLNVKPSDLQKDILSLHSLEEKKVSNKLRNTINFNPVKKLDDLGQIVVDAKDNNDESDLTIIVTNYSWMDDFLYRKQSSTGKIILPKKLDEIIKEKGKKKLLNLINTTFYEPPQNNKQLYSFVNELQEKIITLENIIGDTQTELGTNNDRIELLRYNLIGVNELGKVLKGYNGTLLNLVNDIDIATYTLMKSSQMDWNRIWGPTDNDYTRSILHASELYLNFTGKSELDIDIKMPFPFGVHGEGIVFDKENIFFGNKTWDQQFENQSETLFEELLNKVGSHGFEYLKREGKVSEDSVVGLMYTIGSILTEKNNELHRGSVLDKDYDFSTGRVFNILKGTISFPSDPNQQIETASSKARKQFNEGTSIIHKLTNKLRTEGFIQEYETGTKELNFPEKIVLEEPKSALTKILDVLEINKSKTDSKPSNEKKKSEVLFYVRNPDYRSLSLYDLNSSNMFKKEIIFPDADDKTSILGIKTFEDKGVVLLEKQGKKDVNKKNMIYQLFSINYDTQEVTQIKDFSSKKIFDFDYLNNELFYVSEKDFNVKVLNLESGETQIYKDPVVEKEFFLVKALKMPNGFGIFGLREDGILYWNKNDFKYPVKMAKLTSLSPYINVHRLNGKQLLMYGEKDNAKMIDITNYQNSPASIKTTGGIIGIYSHNGKIETFGVNSNNKFVKTHWKSYNRLLKGKIKNEEFIYLGDDEIELLENKILNINTTKNNVVIGGLNGYLICKRDPFEFEGKIIEQTTRCQSIIQRT